MQPSSSSAEDRGPSPSAEDQEPFPWGWQPLAAAAGAAQASPGALAEAQTASAGSRLGMPVALCQQPADLLQLEPAAGSMPRDHQLKQLGGRPNPRRHHLQLRAAAASAQNREILKMGV